MPGAGKSEAVQVARELGAQVLRMGDAVWEEVRHRRLPLEAAVVGQVADEMRRTHGPDIWARRTLDAIRGDADLVIIDGLRSGAELRTFKRVLGEDFVLVRIDCPKELRYARVSSRGRADDTATRRDFEERDLRELSWGLGEVLQQAQLAIDNTGTVGELRARVIELFDGLKA
jgi:dephospho-CoA kinase